MNFRVLVATPMSDFDEYIERNANPFPDFVTYDIVRSLDQYNVLSDKYSYDALIVWFGGLFVQTVLNDQALYSKKIRWVHSLTAGVDNYLLAKEFMNAEHLPLTNSKGCFSQGLAEYIAFGLLYHTKNLEKLIENQQAKVWQVDFNQLVHSRVVAIVGFGDIGACAGKIAKKGFQAKVIGVKRRPEITSEEHRACADEIVGLDQLDRVLA